MGAAPYGLCEELIKGQSSTHVGYMWGLGSLVPHMGPTWRWSALWYTYLLYML